MEKRISRPFCIRSRKDSRVKQARPWRMSSAGDAARPVGCASPITHLTSLMMSIRGSVCRAAAKKGAVTKSRGTIGMRWFFCRTWRLWRWGGTENRSSWIPAPAAFFSAERLVSIHRYGARWCKRKDIIENKKRGEGGDRARLGQFPSRHLPHARRYRPAEKSVGGLGGP